MLSIAFRMLAGDRLKYLGLIFGVAFATLLLAQQGSIFVGLLSRAANPVYDVLDAQLWVMDSRVKYIEEVERLRDVDLLRVRSVHGVEWAVPYYRGVGIARTERDEAKQVLLLGVDDSSLVGAPRKLLVGNLQDLQSPDSVLMDSAGFSAIWPGEPLAAGKIIEINDRRVRIAGIFEGSVPFATFPVIYATYGQALELVPPTRTKLPFVLVRVNQNADVNKVAQAIRDRTGLTAITTEDFAWRSVLYILNNTGIPQSFGTVIILGIIVGAVIVGLTFYQFVSDNLRQFGVLKAIGVSNIQIIGMVTGQAILIGLIGYGLGIGAATGFFIFGKGVVALQDFYLLWQISIGIAILLVFIMILATAVGVRRVLVLDPAVVFKG